MRPRPVSAVEVLAQPAAVGGPAIVPAAGRVAITSSIMFLNFPRNYIPQYPSRLTSEAAHGGAGRCGGHSRRTCRSLPGGHASPSPSIRGFPASPRAPAGPEQGPAWVRHGAEDPEPRVGPVTVPHTEPPRRVTGPLPAPGPQPRTPPRDPLAPFERGPSQVGAGHEHPVLCLQVVSIPSSPTKRSRPGCHTGRASPQLSRSRRCPGAGERHAVALAQSHCRGGTRLLPSICEPGWVPCFDKHCFRSF